MTYRQKAFELFFSVIAGIPIAFGITMTNEATTDAISSLLIVTGIILALVPVTPLNCVKVLLAAVTCVATVATIEIADQHSLSIVIIIIAMAVIATTFICDKIIAKFA